MLELVERGDIDVGISRTNLEKQIGLPYMIYQIPYDKKKAETRQYDCLYSINDLIFTATFDNAAQLVAFDFEGRLLLGEIRQGIYTSNH